MIKICVSIAHENFPDVSSGLFRSLPLWGLSLFLHSDIEDLSVRLELHECSVGLNLDRSAVGGFSIFQTSVTYLRN